MAENSVSSCWRVEHSKRAEKWILLCSNNAKLEDEIGNGFFLEGGRRLSRAEFHMLDLSNDKIHRYCLPSLVQFVVTDSMVAFDNFVYIFGYCSSVLDSSDFKRLQYLQSMFPSSHQNILLGASRLDLDQAPHAGWCSTPVPSENASLPKCTTLLGKIYTFGTLYLNPEVLDPVDGNWKSLDSRPDELVGCTLSNHALPDPSNKRFLVHLSDGQLQSPSLYAFFPPGVHSADVNGTGIWKCITRDFRDWTHIAVVFDGVIYFHSRKFYSVLRAFDITTGKWLGVHWVSCFDDNRDFNDIRMEFDALLLLADGIMCLAAWSPIDAYDDQPAKTSTFFYKFNVERSGETIKLCPLAFRSYELLATSRVKVFLPV